MKKSRTKNYLEVLKNRRKRSRVYVPHQGVGLFLAELLADQKHKTLYIKLAREYDEQVLLTLAKDVAQRKKVKNKGAYFMKVFAKVRKQLVPKDVPKKPKQLKLKLRKRRINKK